MGIIMTKWIAVADDDITTLKVAGRILNNNNLRMSGMNSGMALLSFLRENRPDLILLDGGSGQVNAVRPVLANMGLLDKVTLFGMVKDSKHRTRAIATGGGEVAINDNRRAFTLVSDIQEEVHRYSIAYHRQRQSKEMTAMTLTEIPGIGKKTATDLLKHFKTLKAVRKATVEELKAVEGIGAKTAESIYNYYRQ